MAASGYDTETRTGTRSVILAKYRLWLPDDGLCKPKHVGATFIILNVSVIILYNLCALVEKIKKILCLI